MLGKLLKYEWKATARVFVPFYLAVVLFATINRFFIAMQITEGWTGLIAGLSGTAYALAILATLALTVFIIIQRFYKNLLGDEGYLMFTLPVKTWQNITAKLLIAAAWVVISTAVVFGSVFIMVAQKGMMAEVSRAIEVVVNELKSINLNIGVSAALFIVGIVVSLFTGILFLYASISIGQLFSRHKLIASFGAFLGLNIVSQILSSILLAMTYFVNPQLFIVNNQTTPTFIYIMLIGTLAINLIMGIGYYIASEQILTKRLNLD